ncbi:MAG: GGDEF domain-containing protein [Candidatus Latescibacteria bacterium]|jgi:diguanylate cyclase (GGDEF)-like protein|nr:GGDEF domain-containing protein [Candidatus Latescibacterota bacterium]
MNTSEDPATLQRRIQELESEIQTQKAEIKRLRDENRRWARLAGTESTTGLPNKISFMRAMVPQAIQRASRESKPAGFMLLSADNLGDVNESYGREAGDRVIQGLAELLQSLLEEDDRLGHLDGTNFAVIFYPADLDTVRGRANMLRARIRSHAFPCAGETVPITASVGIGSVDPEDNPNARAVGEEIFRLLNGALYRAKKAGGNRVEAIEAASAGRKESNR